MSSPVQPSFTYFNNVIPIRPRSPADDEEDTESVTSADSLNIVGYADSDFGETDLEVKLLENLECIDKDMITKRWKLVETNWKYNGEPVLTIKDPTCSGIYHRYLHPSLYRNIRNVGTLNMLAALIKAPTDWEDRYNEVITFGRGIVLNMLASLQGLHVMETEANVSAKYTVLVVTIANSLFMNVSYLSEKMVILGGLLAHGKYEIKSRTDPVFYFTDNMKKFLASELKREESFPQGEVWYRDTRGPQTLTALYAYNAPTLLLTQRQFKLFVENESRDQVLTYPFGDSVGDMDHINSALMAPVGRNLVKVIVICLLAKFDSLSAQSTQISVSATTPIIENISEKNKHSVNLPIKKRKKLDPSLPPPRQPQFIDGINLDGTPRYRIIKVYSDEEVHKWERKIAEEDGQVLNEGCWGEAALTLGSDFKEGSFGGLVG